MTVLQDLLAKVETGQLPRPLPFSVSQSVLVIGAFNGSLDAAKALHDAVLPDQSCGITFGGEYGATITFPPTWDRMSISESNLIPARAWLAAILRALIAQEGEA